MAEPSSVKKWFWWIPVALLLIGITISVWPKEQAGKITGAGTQQSASKNELAGITWKPGDVVRLKPGQIETHYPKGIENYEVVAGEVRAALYSGNELVGEYTLSSKSNIKKRVAKDPRKLERRDIIDKAVYICTGEEACEIKISLGDPLYK